MSTKNSVTFSISCQHAEPEVEGERASSNGDISIVLNSRIEERKATECKNNFLCFSFRTIKFVINASGLFDAKVWSEKHREKVVQQRLALNSSSANGSRSLITC